MAERGKTEEVTTETTLVPAVTTGWTQFCCVN